MAFRSLHPGQRSQLVVASRDGAKVEVVIETDRLIEAPNWSPDGRWLVVNAEGRLYRIAPEPGGTLAEIDSGRLDALNNDHVISPDGRWLYVSNDDGHLYRLPFSGGAPLRLSNDHDPARGFRYYLHGISPDGGTLAYVGLERMGEAVMTRICTLPALGGADLMLTDGACPVDGPEFSPDGAWIWFNSEAAARTPGQAQIFRMRRDGTGAEQITDDERVNWFPHLTPDGSLVAYLSYPPGTEGHPADRDVIVRVMRPDGTGQRDIDRFNGGQGSLNVASWSPDSARFAYMRYPTAG